MEPLNLSGTKLSLEYDLKSQRTFGPCPDCGQMTKRVWGYAYDSGTAIAAYFVEWTPSHPDNEATFDLIIGEWGEAAQASDRQAVAVEYRLLSTGPAFRIQDAATRPVGSSALISKALGRETVIGTPLAALVFSICDLIYAVDSRVSELQKQGKWSNH